MFRGERVAQGPAAGVEWRRGAVLAAAVLGTAFAYMSDDMLNLAIPSVAHDLRATTTAVQWCPHCCPRAAVGAPLRRHRCPCFRSGIGSERLRCECAVSAQVLRARLRIARRSGTAR